MSCDSRFSQKMALKLWLEFLTHFTGKSFFLEFQWLSSLHLHLYTDASGSLGYGAVFPENWFYGPWPPEMFPIVLSIKIWGTCLQNDILFKAVHLPGVHNTKANALSRLQVTKCKSLCPRTWRQNQRLCLLNCYQRTGSYNKNSFRGKLK